MSDNMNIEKLKQNFKLYCLDSHNCLFDNDLAIDYEINHNGIFAELISIEEGYSRQADEFDFYIVDNDFYNDFTDYIIITPLEEINLPVGDDSELEYFHFGVKIVENKIFYGICEGGEFEEFSQTHLLYSDNANLHELLLEKMKKLMKFYR